MAVLAQLPLSFLAHPAMLGWLMAAAAPLIIHLLNRRKYREVPWAAMQYLLAAVRKNSRRILIEQWLLLAVRTLLIALLVIAVAEPLLKQAGLKLGSGERTHKVLVIDGSFSMAYKPTDASRFDRAKELAARIVKESSQGDGFTLVLLADPPRVVVGAPAFEPHDFCDEIENLKLPHGGGDLPATLIKVEEILKMALREYPRLTRREVYMLTDLGRNTWVPDLQGSAALAEFRQRSQKLGGDAVLVVIDLGQTDAENLAVSSLSTNEPFATIARHVSLEAEIRNFGRQPRNQQLVELWVDQRRVGQQHVEIAAGGRASVAFPYRFDSSGNHTVEIRLGTDLLDVDNHRWLSVPVKDHLRVLCIDGKPAGGTFQGATDYLAVALSPAGEPSEPALVHPQVMPESALLEVDLRRYDCIFLANVGQFTSSEARVLRSYLQHGGGLVFFLGDQVQADSYNHHLAGTKPDDVRVLPARLGDLVAEAKYFFDPLDYEHSMLAAFRGQERAGLLTTPVYRYFKLDIQDNPQARVALAFDNGDPVVVEQSIGHGRSILVATSADVSWTTMPMWPSYVPIVQELLALAVRGQAEERNPLVGQALGGAVHTLATQVDVTVKPPDGEPESIRLSPDGDVNRWTYPDTIHSGMYQVTFGSPISKDETYAVNVDTAESDLTKLDPDELAADVWPGVNFVQRTDWQDLGEEPVEQIVQQNSLHQALLAMVLVLLFLETFLAWYFGWRTQ